MSATPKMINFAEKLIEQCGYDINDYDLQAMTFQEVSSLIDELKEEQGREEKGSYHARRRD